MHLTNVYMLDPTEMKLWHKILILQTSEGHLILYNVEAASEQTAYQQYDPPTASLRRDSAELFVKEVIPSLHITLVINETIFYYIPISNLYCFYLV